MSTEKQATEEKKTQTSGLRAVLDKALDSYEKLPMLEIVFERLVRLLTTSLRNLTSETVDINIKGFSSQRFSSYYNTIKTPASITVFKVLEWENYGLIVIDNALTFSLVDLLFGGKKNPIQPKSEPRSHTYIEQGLLKQISEVILTELSSSFDPISPATCVFERQESNPNFANIARPGDAVIALKLTIDLFGRGGNVDVIIPYATLEPIKDLLQQVFIGEKFGVDPDWEEGISDKLYTIDLPLEAVIINKPVAISNVANLKIGDTIITDQKNDDDIILRIGNIHLLKGKIGKIEQHVAVHITEVIDNKV